MPSNFPGGLDSFTTKVDGIDDIMADHVNDLQNSVVAVETLLLAKLTGWINWPTQPVYVSATSIRFNSINLTTLFPTGTKIRLTQTTVKYFYVVSAAYSGGNTTLTLYAGSEFTVANAAITGFGYSHSVTYGFPEYLNYTPTITYAGGTTDPTSLSLTYSRFSIHGKRIFVAVNGQLTRGSGDRLYTAFTLPLNYSSTCVASVTTSFAGGNKAAPSFGQSSNRISINHGAMDSDGYLWMSLTYEI